MLSRFSLPAWLCVCSRTALALVTLLAGAGAAFGQNPTDIVIHVAETADLHGSWERVPDTAAASGARLWQPNAGMPKIGQASAAPQDYFDVQFQAESGRAYRLWVRSKADGNSYVNDSVYVQFSKSINASGAAVYRIGSTSATTVIREGCSGCAFSGWGWQDNEYGNLAPGPEIRFAESGPQTLRVQAREDGISIDQIVLSSATWFTTAPGATNNDTTIVPKTTAAPAASSLAFTRQQFTSAYFDGLAAVDLNGDARRDLAGVLTGGVELYSVMNDGGRAFHLGHASERWESISFVPRVIAGDFNRDGKADLLTLDEFRNLVAVFPGDGTGSFAANQNTSFAEQVKDVAVADFTSDGILDIVVLESALGNAVVHAGTGTGAFSFVSFARAGNMPNETVAADFDGDRHQDVAVLCSGDGAIKVLYGDGSGRFARSTLVPRSALALGAADLDRDGYADLILAVGDTALEIHFGGAAGFSSITTVETSDVPNVKIVQRGIMAADMNGDGRVDLVATHAHESGVLGTATFSIVPSTSARSFGAPEDFAKTTALPAVVSDLDGDTRLDVVSPDSNNGFTIHWNDPTQGNRAPVANAGTDIYVLESEHKGVELDGGSSADADGHALSYTWTESSSGGQWFGQRVQPFQTGTWAPGTYTFTLTVDDFQGGRSSDTVVVTIDRLTPPPSGNRSPIASAHASMEGVWPYDMQFQDWPDPLTYLWNDSTDPDGDALTFEWKNAAGQIISTTGGWNTMDGGALFPGVHTFTLTVRDGRGGEDSATVTVSVTNYEEIVINGSGYKEHVVGTEWQEWVEGEFPNATYTIRDLDAGEPKVTAPLASPASYVDYGFVADPTLEYKLWIRLKAHGDSWANDSIWVQFSGATDASGNPVFREGTTSGVAVNLEECNGCGVSGYGWRDEAWGARGVMGTAYLRFPAGGVQSLRIQTREDGVVVSQIVLSARKYKTTRPGMVKGDTTQLAHNSFWGS